MESFRKARSVSLKEWGQCGGRWARLFKRTSLAAELEKDRWAKEGPCGREWGRVIVRELLGEIEV